MEFKNSLIGTFTAENSKPTDENNIHKIKVYVYGKDGPTAHIHIIGSESDNICIRIDTEEYYWHKNHYGRLTKYELAAFCDFIKENWFKAKDAWNRNAEEYNGETTRGKRTIVTRDTPPDYSKLKARK